jgi:hypothetical protein
MIYGLKDFVKKKFDTEQFEMRGEFPVLWKGWECDETAAVIAVEGTVYVVGSNHGALCLLGKAFLLEKAREYADVLTKTLAAAEYLD